MAFLVVCVGLLFSCKDNKDGYSDDIVTNPNPSDSLEVQRDTARSVNDNSANTEHPQSMGSGNSGSETNAGTGTGPGPDANDGEAYTSSAGLRKDSLQPEKKSTEKKSTEKKSTVTKKK